MQHNNPNNNDTKNVVTLEHAELEGKIISQSSVHQTIVILKTNADHSRKLLILDIPGNNPSLYNQALAILKEGSKDSIEASEKSAYYKDFNDQVKKIDGVVIDEDDKKAAAKAFYQGWQKHTYFSTVVKIDSLHAVNAIAKPYLVAESYICPVLDGKNKTQVKVIEVTGNVTLAVNDLIANPITKKLKLNHNQVQLRNTGVHLSKSLDSADINNKHKPTERSISLDEVTLKRLKDPKEVEKVKEEMEQERKKYGQ